MHKHNKHHSREKEERERNEAEEFFSQGNSKLPRKIQTAEKPLNTAMFVISPPKPKMNM
jgi:hypothetical protein